MAVIKLFPRNKAVYDILKTLDLPKSITDKLQVNGKYSFKIGVNQVKFLSSGATHDNRLYWRGLDSREGFTNKIWLSLAKDAKTIIDVGAKMGIFSIIAKGLNPTAKVLAFEPLPKTFEILKNNIAINDFDINAFLSCFVRSRRSWRICL